MDENEVLAKLAAVREALQQGFEDCGEDPDCIYAQALGDHDEAIEALKIIFQPC